MGKINQDLLAKLEKKLNVSRRQIYEKIKAKASEALLPRDLAAIALAADSGISINKFATPEQLAEIRGAALSKHPTPTVVVPGTKSRRRKSQSTRSASTPKRRGNSVFVVHGRNSATRKSLFSFLRSIGLIPIEWTKAIKLTGKGSPHISEILDAAFREAVAVVVLITPDDEAKLRSEFVKSSDPSYEKKLTGQARPNVLFEAGMAFGRQPDSTVLVQIGNVRPFSDVAGRHVVHLSNSAESRQELITKLANAGCNVDSSGTDWFSEGDFSAK